MVKRRSWYELFPHGDGQWGFRFRAANGEKVVVAEGYTRKRDAIRAVGAYRRAAASAGLREVPR
jgi:uncharacterized protein YegP (UPF0339 family)